MAWEWVAPTATAGSGAIGIFFTWLSGHQGRRQVDRMTGETQREDVRRRMWQEKREAYISALRFFRRELLRLAAIARDDPQLRGEANPSSRERLEAIADVAVAVDAFGSHNARHYIQQWIDVGNDPSLRKETYSNFLASVRAELGEPNADIDGN
jgi:hypothetical protein